MRRVVLATLIFLVTSIPFGFWYASALLGPGSAAEATFWMGSIAIMHLIVSGGLAAMTFDLVRF